MPKNAVIYFKQNLVQADRFLLTYQRRRSKIKSGWMKIKLDIPFLSNPPFLQYRKYPRYLQKLTLGLIRPKQKFLGLRLAFTSVYDIFCIGKTMTYDLCFVPASYPVFDYNLLLHRIMSLNMQ